MTGIFFALLCIRCLPTLCGMDSSSSVEQIISVGKQIFGQINLTQSLRPCFCYQIGITHTAPVATHFFENTGMTAMVMPALRTKG